jgi:hypothetical protein
MYGNVFSSDNTVAVRTLSKQTPAASKYGGVGLSGSVYTSGFAMVFSSLTAATIRQSGGTESGVTSNWSVGEYKIWDIKVIKNSHTHWHEGGTELTGSPYSTNPPNVSMSPVFYSYNALSIYSDWILSRKFTSDEPVLISSGVEENNASVTNDPSPTTKAFNIVAVNSSYYAKGYAPSNPVHDDNCTYTLTNTGSSSITVNIKGTNFIGGVGWKLSSSVGVDNVTIIVYPSGIDPSSGVTLTTSDQEFIHELSANSTKKWDFKFMTGTFTDGVAKSENITISCVAH